MTGNSGTIQNISELIKLIDSQTNIVLLVDSGTIVLEVNFSRHTLNNRSAGFLFSDEIVSLVKTSKFFSIRYVSFSFQEIESAVYQITSPYFWHAIYNTPAFAFTEKFATLLDCWYNEIEWVIENLREEPQSRVVNNMLFNLLTSLECELIVSGVCNPAQSPGNGWTHLFNFLRLVDKCCHQHHDVGFYAEKLCITTTYLNKIANRLWHVSPKEILNRQIIMRIKNMLVYTDLTVTEIALKMNFEDSSYLARYFQKREGCSPSVFRNNHRLL